jgi:hypothetical protein
MTSTIIKTKTGKQIACKVVMLDDQELPFNIDVSIRSFYSSMINQHDGFYDIFVKI